MMNGMNVSEPKSVAGSGQTPDLEEAIPCAADSGVTCNASGAALSFVIQNHPL